MIYRFPKFPRICWRFCLLILYSNIRLIVLYQFVIWCCWMFSYGSHIWAWMLFHKHHNKFLFFGFSSFVVILAWYKTLLVRHFSLIGHWCCLIQLHVLAILSFWRFFFVMRINYVFHVGHILSELFLEIT